MTLRNALVSYYSARAAEYERIYDKPERQDDLRQLRVLVQGAFAAAHVFELACGTGYWTQIIAQSGASVVAADASEEMLALARAKKPGPGKVTWMQADAYALPDMPYQFDGGLAAFWWSHVPRRRLREFLQGFHRAFAPGAKIVFFDNTFVSGSSTPISRTDDGGDSYQLRKLDDGSTHEVLKNFPTEPELRATLENLGRDIEVRFLSYYWILTYFVT